MITERSIKLLSSVMLISAYRIKVWRLWLTCFEDGPIRILTFAWWMLKTRKTMVSWQAFPSLPPRAPLAFLSHLKLPFPRLPFQTPATQARLLVEKYVACQSRKSDFGWNRFVFHLAWCVRGLKSLKRFWPYLIVFSASRMVSLSNYCVWCLFFISNLMKSSVVYGAI